MPGMNFKAILPGEGLLEVLNWALEATDKTLNFVQNKMADVGGSMMAGVSGLMQNIGDRASTFTLSGSSHDAPSVEAPKLGLNARKQEMQQTVDTSQFAASFNDIVPPSVGAKLQASIGAGMHV